MPSNELAPLVRFDGVQLIGASAGPDGDLWAIDDAGAVFHAREDGWSERIELGEKGFHSVQPLGNDLLLVNGRCWYRNGAGERNAVIFRDGKPAERFCFGDGIQEVQVAYDGTIWTSYFDEGVFGNYGWNDPVGKSGLCAWNAGGERLYEFWPEGCDSICDAYALNVADSAVWIYFYNSFELVRLSRRKIDGVWRGCPRGARSFAVDQKRLLIDGGYDQHDVYHLLSLTAQGVKEEKTLRFTCEDRAIGGALAFGRGPYLHFVEEGRWFRVDLRSID